MSTIIKKWPRVPVMLDCKGNLFINATVLCTCDLITSTLVAMLLTSSAPAAPTTSGIVCLQL
jgi:hypothetical protein